MQEMNILSAEEFRQRLAGITVSPSKVENKEEIKSEAIKYVSILPELFSSDLDRKTLWERTGNGVSSACKRCGGDFDEFVNLSLEFIKASPGVVASNERLEEWLEKITAKDDEYKAELIRMFSKKINVILVFGRQAWNEHKAGL